MWPLSLSENSLHGLALLCILHHITAVKCNHVLHSFTKLTINHLTGAASPDWTLLWGICVLEGKVVCTSTFRSFQPLYWCNFLEKYSRPLWRKTGINLSEFKCWAGGSDIIVSHHAQRNEWEKWSLKWSVTLEIYSKKKKLDRVCAIPGWCRTEKADSKPRNPF